MTQVRKPNRRSGPERVTQRGTRTTYPQPNFPGLARKQDRYAGAEVQPVPLSDSEVLAMVVRAFSGDAPRYWNRGHE